MNHTKSALAALALVSTGAFAQTAPAADYTLAYNVGVVSDYRFRGIEQTAGQGSIQGGIDYAHKSGFYAGAFFANNIKWVKDVNGASKGDYEIDLYGGYKTDIGSGLTLDLGAITYQYPGNDSGAVGTLGAGGYSKADTTEGFVGLSYSVATLKYYQSFGDFLGNKNSNGSRYIDLSATFDLGNGMTLTPHIGRQTVPNQSFGTLVGNAADYTDYSLALAKDMGNGLVVSATAIATNADHGFYAPTYGNTNRLLGKSTLVVGLKYNF
jgi:uncharacterized protein (TIGR02001 family)